MSMSASAGWQHEKMSSSRSSGNVAVSSIVSSGGRECFLGVVFGEFDVAEPADERGQNTAPVLAEDLLKH